MTNQVFTESGDDVLTPPSGGSRRQGKYLALVGIFFYLGAIWYFGWQNIRDRALGADFGLIAAAAAIILVSTWMRILKWRYALGANQHAAGLFFMSKATGDLTPGRLGEFAPMALRTHRTARIGAWILFDRIIEILTTVALGFYGLVVIELLPIDALVVVLAVTLVGCIVGIYMLTHRGMFLRIASRLTRGSFIQRVLRLLASISEEVYQFTASLPVVLPITIVTKAMDLYAVLLIFRALGASPSFGLVAAAKCALAIVSFMPVTPTATGVPHGVQLWLMNRVDDIPSDLLLVGIGIEVVVVSATFWTSAGLGARLIHRAALAKKETLS